MTGKEGHGSERDTPGEVGVVFVGPWRRMGGRGGTRGLVGVGGMTTGGDTCFFFFFFPFNCGCMATTGVAYLQTVRTYLLASRHLFRCCARHVYTTVQWVLHAWIGHNTHTYLARPSTTSTEPRGCCVPLSVRFTGSGWPMDEEVRMEEGEKEDIRTLHCVYTVTYIIRTTNCLRTNLHYKLPSLVLLQMCH